MLAGIGFTMSIFIAMLAFDSEIYITTSKIAILIASLIAALLGLVFLRIILAKQLAEETELID
jgi:NhaA family Na+:H+ antiporter